MPDNEHHECLRTVSVLLNRAQDIEDVLKDYDGDDRYTYIVLRIREINERSLEAAAGYLPG